VVDHRASGYDALTMFWRRKNAKKPKQEEAPDEGRQVWAHNPNALTPIVGGGVDLTPVTNDDGQEGKVYSDEIDPEWADPETAE
jgi:hypothetical protein